MKQEKNRGQKERANRLLIGVHRASVALTEEEKKLLAALRDPIKGPKLRAIMRGSQRT